MNILTNKYIKKCTFFFIYSSIILLNGCDHLVLMHPKGSIGLEERSLIIIAFGMMLIIVIPVIIMTLLFTIKYRATNNTHTKYNPNWIESKKIEYATWIIPIIIIIILSILTWHSTHKLDPKNPIYLDSKIVDPIIVNVIALNWKWLFIYPQHNIAIINELVFPANVPIRFNITSNSVMNSFFIPQLGSQIYAMAGMQTQLNLIANKPGKYKGISSNFSGQGFSGMKFIVIATNNKKEFTQWVQKAQRSIHHLNNMNAYEKLAKPSMFDSITYFSNIQPNLFDSVINKFKH
ncbi:ubiquinol oxidase, subunit II [Candidatus Blochmanniella vafra str. BVAF]|uniref:Ubiquinol oxidase subunit 2 n=1 Tax=Blochmanniella vafra (strain BVAF) TaxID=859654 RepID=E8Q628_BLOVB|nr:ubiquinol oxidase subunit II [Candidatus Blochmannia vafer]ADV33644.1 ubiquinol oxidase, subunit II [Candidatus Blochmannia vafer str. BVAF]